MTDALIDGFLLSLGLILAIGAQNAFVLRQGLRREHVFAVAMLCGVSDALLISAGVAGFGALSVALPWLTPALRYGGAAFLCVYGLRAFRAAWRGGEHLDPARSAPQSLWRVMATCLALTWLNPHVYLDTLMLLGTISSQYGGLRWWFGAGAAMASFTFFFGLAYGARLLAPVFARPGAWRVLELVIGCIMWVIAAQLALAM